MKESYFENEHVELWIADGVIYEIFKPNLKVINIENAKEIVRDRLKVSNGITRPMFVDLCNAVSIDKESRTCLAEGDAMKYLSAMAILVKNQITKFGANVYIRFDEPLVPTKVFTDKKGALKWLERYKYLN